MNRKHSAVFLCGLVLAASAVLGAAASAAGATSDDPLVSLSYLNGTYSTQIMSTAENYAESTANVMESTLQNQVAGFKESMTDPTIQNSAVSEYQTVILAAGESVSVPAGSQLLFLEGSAAVSGVYPLSDNTSGSSLAKGGALTANHLYYSVNDTAVTASSDAKLLLK